MEIDEFTEQLMERSKARKEYLRKKMSEMRKRTALVDENQLPETLEDQDDSPKRQRLVQPVNDCKKAAVDQDMGSKFEAEDNEMEEEDDTEEEDDEEDKENVQNTSESSDFVPYCSYGARGLAALKKSKNQVPSNIQDNDKRHLLEDPSDSKECQGYVKSESSSRLVYDFQGKSKNDPSENQTSQSSSNKKQLPSAAVVNGSKKELLCAEKSESKGSSDERIADPAELPLSARKALFEKAFQQGKMNEDDPAQKMSVAQRAALFEKSNGSKNFLKSPQKPYNRQLSPSKSPKRNLSPLKSPMKSLSPMKITEQRSPLKSSLVPSSDRAKLSPSPSKSVAFVSPSKNVGPHTRQVQQQLTENSTNDCRQKDMVGKASSERKNEISSLLNHWEKLSSANYETAQVKDRERKQSSSSACSDRYPTVFEEQDEESENEDEILKDNMGQKEVETSESEAEYDESTMDSEDDKPCENVTSSGFEFRKCEDDDEEDDELSSEVAVDDIIDEAMEEALKDEVVMPPPPPPPAPIVTVDTRFCKSFSSSVSSTGSFGSTDSQSSTKDERSEVRGDSPSSCTPSQSNADSETSLMHTVSFYRRQKQQKRATPTKTIVRRETVSSPPSPEEKNTKEILRRNKALQEEILAQQTVISQTSQALNLCLATEEFSGSTEQVECERLLLIATQRRQACLGEIQRLKSLLSTGKKLAEDTGTLILNDIRLPLKQDFILSQKDGKNNEDVHYFICLIRHGHQVVVTQMLSAQDGVQQGSLCFTNHITLHELPPDFCVAFEVYTLRTKKEVLSHDKKYHIRKEHSRLRLSTKAKKGDSRLMSPVISSPGGPNAVRSPNFAVVGFTRFTLQNCNRQIYTLEKVPFSSPLDGVLKVNMHLHAEHKIAERGFLTMFDDVSGFGAWHRRWCLLDGKDVAFWKYPDDEKRKEPMLVINLKQIITSQVKLVSRDVCARPHSFEIVTVRPQAKGDKNSLISRSVNTLTTTKYLLSADTKDERILWCNRLNDALMNVRKWDPNAMRPVDVRHDK